MRADMSRVDDDGLAPPALLGEAIGGPGAHRPFLRAIFIAGTAFFTLSPLVSMLAHPPAPPATALLLVGWAIFGAVLAVLFRGSPFRRPGAGRWVAAAAVAMTVIAVVVAAVFGTTEGIALFFYSGIAFARLGRERVAVGGVMAVGLAAFLSGIAASDWAAGLTVGVTVVTISLTLFALSALGRSSRDLQEARIELAELAVADERARIARDLHDTLGHSLSVIALKSELAERLVADDPERARAEILDVQRVARESLAAVRETVSGYRRPTLSVELAGARAALAAAGIEGRVEPGPDDLPPDVDAVLGWAVREGVTNVLRHSDATTARIRVIADGDLRTVEVEDDGRGAPLQPDAPSTRGGGTGLAGLRERASRLGGFVEAGPLPGQGFRLRVTVSMEGTA